VCSLAGAMSRNNQLPLLSNNLLYPGCPHRPPNMSHMSHTLSNKPSLLLDNLKILSLYLALANVLSPLDTLDFPGIPEDPR
jgi:hypothetical protein